MKPELKHLAPYLPYEVEVEYTRKIYPKETTHQILSINTLRLCESAPSKFSIKPLLLPMSSLYTEMEDGTVHIVELAKQHIEYDEKKGDYDFKLESCFARQIRLDITWMHTAYSEPLYDDRLFIQTQRTHLNPYWVNEYLFSHHFDVFGLIPQNLAIDINTLK